jgi:hypothetical protein
MNEVKNIEFEALPLLKKKKKEVRDACCGMMKEAMDTACNHMCVRPF